MIRQSKVNLHNCALHCTWIGQFRKRISITKGTWINAKIKKKIDFHKEYTCVGIASTFTVSLQVKNQMN